MITVTTIHITDTRISDSRVQSGLTDCGQESGEVIIKMQINYCFPDFALGIINN